MIDSLGNRMKANYENRTRFFVPRRTYTVIRVDGRAFHTFTRGCERPFDTRLIAAMDATALFLCREIDGAKCAYVQSDEISVVLTDFDRLETQAWFDGNIQKIASLRASLATAAFNAAIDPRPASVEAMAQFDSRVFTIPDREEVVNYFVWRQLDATRNSIQMAASAHFSQARLHGKTCDELQEMLFAEKAVNWNDYPDGCKRGRMAVRKTTTGPVEYVDKRTGETRATDAVERHTWEIEVPPRLQTNRQYVYDMLPSLA